MRGFIMPKVQSKEDANGGVHLTITCETCGEPIDKTSDFGMDCKNDCAQKEFNRLFPRYVNQPFIPSCILCDLARLFRDDAKNTT